jgi:uncharacterized membrane protein
MKLSEKSRNIIVGFICVIYVLLRLRNLTGSCLWFDEIFSVHAAGLGWREMFWFVAQDLIHPPLFYVFLKIWISIGGEGLFWLRLFPALFSTLALIPLYLLCREFKLKNYSIISVFLLIAANGALIKYTQEVRMYAVLLCFSLVSTWLFGRWTNINKGFWALFLINTALIYTHYFGWFVISCEALAAVILFRDKIEKIVLMLGVLILSYAPWVYAIWQASKINANVSQNIGWMSKPTFSVFFQFAFDLIEPFYFQTSNADSASLYYISIPLLLVVFAVSVIFLFDWKSFDETTKRNFITLVIFLKLPILLAFTASWLLPYSIFGTRHLIIVFVPLTLLMVLMIENLKSDKAKIAIFGTISFFIIISFTLEIRRKTETFIWCAWEDLAGNLPQENADQPTKVYVFEDLTAYHFWFALHEKGENFQIIKVGNIKGLPEDKAYFLPRGFYDVQTIDENSIAGDRFYVAFRAKGWNAQKPPLVDLIEKGYVAGSPQIFEAQGEKAFLVEMRKEN